MGRGRRRGNVGAGTRSIHLVMVARERPTRNKCIECGKILSANPYAKRCMNCYQTRRGIPSQARPKPRCKICGKITSKNATQCMECWHARGSNKPAAKPVYREPLTSYEEARKVWDREIGRKKEKLKAPPKKPKGKRETILVLPDLHVPFHDTSLLADVIARFSGKVSRVIAIGDISDSYSFSTYLKYERVSFAEEWGQVTAVMATLSEAFPSIEIIVGNHDARLEKRLRTNLSPDMIDAVQYMTGGTLCPLTALTKQFDNVSIARHEVPNSKHTVDWFTTIGDAWLGHPEKFSKTPGSALRSVEDWLLDNEVTLGLDRYRLIVLGHTHQLACLPWRASMLVECGCLCQVHGYQTSPRIGGRPQKRGMIWFDQVDGVTDLNSVRMHWYDAE